MRYLIRVVLTLYLPFILFVSSPLSGEQSFLIDPENPPEVVTVQSWSDFNLTLEGRGWYLNRYDRNLLSFKIRRVEPSSTVFVMRSLEQGTAQLILSLKQLDIPLIVVSTDKPEQTDEGLSVLKDEETGSLISSEQEKSPSVLKKAEALRHRGLVEEQKTEEKQAELMDGSIDKQSVQDEQAEEKLETPLKKSDAAAQTPSHKDDIYYVDEDERVVKVPREQEEDFFRRGKRYFKKGELGKAVQELHLYLSNCKKCLNSDKARLRLADILLQLSDEEGALLQLGKVIESGGEEALLSALKTRAHLYYGAGRYEEALRDYEDIYNQGNGSEELLQLLGDINYTLHHEAEALRWYEAGIVRGAATDEMIFRVATIYDSPGSARDIEKAYTYYSLITEKYQSSKYYRAALQRVQFFESHFFDYY